MPEWFWAASGILAALLTVLSIISLFDENGAPCITLPTTIGLIYLTAWIWSHT
jgi:hypothetical protein